MEVYILDPVTFLRVKVIDQFISMVWTERYRDIGDFVLTMTLEDEVNNSSNRDLFVGPPMLTINDSYRVMMVENIENDVNEDGTKTITVTGSSIEKILLQRVAAKTFVPTPPTGAPANDPASITNWSLTDTPGNICREIFKKICKDGQLKTADILPNMSTDTTSSFPADTLIEPSVVETIEVPPQSVFEAIRQICDLYDLGFRLYRNPYTHLLLFEVYAGRNLTTAQTAIPPVLFTPEMDNLINTKELTTISELMNSIYVFSPYGYVIVYDSESSETYSGFKRKVLMVDGSSSVTDDMTPAQVTDALTLQGNIALAEHRAQLVFDGEVDQHSAYKYGKDYHVGDLIEVRAAKGQDINYMRVTEQILTCDAEGDKSYPTLTKNLTFALGSWAAWNPTQQWQQVPAIEDGGQWEDQPH